MEVVKSPLELIDFNIIKAKFSFEHPVGKKEINVIDVMSGYELDFDYMIKTNNENSYAIFTKVIVNEGETKLPGHSIFAEGVSIFRINPSELKSLRADDVKSLINFSAVSIAFSNIRGFISDMTSYTPSGKYLFPVFNLKSLIENKQERMLAIKTAEAKTKVKSTTKEPVKKTEKVIKN